MNNTPNNALQRTPSASPLAPLSFETLGGWALLSILLTVALLQGCTNCHTITVWKSRGTDALQGEVLHRRCGTAMGYIIQLYEPGYRPSGQVDDRAVVLAVSCDCPTAGESPYRIEFLSEHRVRISRDLSRSVPISSFHLIRSQTETAGWHVEFGPGITSQSVVAAQQRASADSLRSAALAAEL